MIGLCRRLYAEDYSHQQNDEPCIDRRMQITDAKKNGPRTEPCETSCKIGKSLESNPLIKTNCFLYLNWVWLKVALLMSREERTNLISFLSGWEKKGIIFVYQVIGLIFKMIYLAWVLGHQKYWHNCWIFLQFFLEQWPNME